MTLDRDKEHTCLAIVPMLLYKAYFAKKNQDPEIKYSAPVNLVGQMEIRGSYLVTLAYCFGIRGQTDYLHR
jgi:hypothetical protein